MGGLGLRHNGNWRAIKKPPLGWAASSLSFCSLQELLALASRPCGLRSVARRARTTVISTIRATLVIENGVKLLIGTIPVNPSFNFPGQTRDNPAQTRKTYHFDTNCRLAEAAHRRPRMFCASRRMSASTPAAVTSPPAPRRGRPTGIACSVPCGTRRKPRIRAARPPDGWHPHRSGRTVTFEALGPRARCAARCAGACGSFSLAGRRARRPPHRAWPATA